MAASSASCRPASSSVVICAHTTDRWDDLVAAVASIHAQTAPPNELVVVIDHNVELFQRAVASLDHVRVIENSGPRGLAGARNTGIGATTGSVVVFLDDDATAEVGCLALLMAHYDDDHVLGVGGGAQPAWDGEAPRWFPDEFLWVVGCAYRGLPTTAADIRNLIGCIMSVRRDVLEAVGRFDVDLGRTATRPLGCEETELCIRARQMFERGRFIYEPVARVHHRVPAARQRWGYFRDRCRAEGVSKAWVSARVGSEAALSSERSYASRTLPLGVAKNLRALASADVGGGLRAMAIVAGLGYTTAGFVTERVRSRRSSGT